MTSYQRRKQEADQLKQEVEELKLALYNDTKTVFANPIWLGVGRLTFGVVVNDKLVELDISPMNLPLRYEIPNQTTEENK